MHAKPPILRVALDVPLDRTFDYLNNGFDVLVGNRVVVPFAGRQMIGVVMDLPLASDIEEAKLKSVIHVFDDVVLDDASHKLLKFCADYYHYPLGQILISTLPLRLRQIKPAVTRKSFQYVLVNQPTVDIPKRMVVLQRILQAFDKHNTLSDYQLAEISSGWRKAIAPLLAAGHIRADEVITVKPSMPSSSVIPSLNPEQSQAITQILSEINRFRPCLLYGVTGSGKTEVYIRLLEAVLHHPKAQVLVLVPEINLTPQLEARFRSRLSQFPLVTLHSNLSESERLQNWQAAKAGSAKIVIGTRLSVFTPMPYLKLIIIDEEHDGSYKQQDGMRYHARDVAMMRAKQLDISIVLGSATPSLETWHHAMKSPTSELAKKQSYSLITLSHRAVAKATLPRVSCIDTAKSPVENGFSPILKNAIKQRLALGEQTLLFLNRRGYAPVLHCNACQWSSACTRCSAKLVVHLNQRRLKCHHCGQEQKIPIQCPSCGNPDLHPIGQATQRLTETLKQLYPHAKIERVDRDSMRTKHALTDMLTKVHQGEVDILVGTQMLAKGHDFPNLTLVGVLDTDSALYSPDFRASERLFAQLMQVAGRAGRGDKPGEVLIQTNFPQHDLFHALQAHDFTRYANALLLERTQMQFPPLSYFAVLKAEAVDFLHVQRFLSWAGDAARGHQTSVMIYDPVRPAMERLKGMERGHLLLQAQSRKELQRLLNHWIPELRAHPLSKKMRWILDIDPMEF